RTAYSGFSSTRCGRRSSPTPASSRISPCPPTPCAGTIARWSRRWPSTTATPRRRSPTPTWPAVPSTCSTQPKPAMAERAPEAIAARDGELRADLDAGLRFAHVLGSQAKRGVVDFVVAVEALVEEMMESGRVDAARLAERTDRVRAGELKRMEEHE